MPKIENKIRLKVNIDRSNETKLERFNNNKPSAKERSLTSETLKR